jgi:surface protein
MPGWDTSLVTSLEGLFKDKRSFNQDISAWDVRRVTNMENLFFNSFRFNGDISKWDVSSVTNMDAMFGFARKFNRDLAGWNVGRVLTTRSMFTHADAFNGDVRKWNVGSVTQMDRMFEEALAFHQNLSGWQLRKDRQVSVSNMFLGATEWLGKYTNCGYDKSDASVCSGTEEVSSGAYAGPPGTWTQLPASHNACIGGVASAFPSFAALKTVVDRCLAAVPSGDNCCSSGAANCGVACTVDMPGWDTSLVTSLEGLFKDKRSFNQDISAWDVRRVTNMKETFSATRSLNENIGGWNTWKCLIVSLSIIVITTNVFNVFNGFKPGNEHGKSVFQ